MTEIMIPRQFFSFFATALVAGIAMYGITIGNLVTACLPLLLLIGVFFIVKPHALLWVLIAISFSQFRIPFTDLKIELFYLLACLFAIIAVFHNITDKSFRNTGTPRKIWVFAFSLVVVAVIILRGIDFLASGEELWGTGAYIRLFAAIFFYIAADKITIKARTLRTAIFAMYFFGCIPSIAHALYIFTNGSIYYQYAFVAFPGVSDWANSFASDLYRLEPGAQWLPMALPFLMWRNPFSLRVIPATAVLMATSLILAGMTGHRAMLFDLLFPSLIFFAISSRKNIIPAFCLLLVMSLFLSLAVIYVQHFPFAVQRALSAVPFADISNEAMADAEGTTIWRVDMWRTAIREVPRYLLIGKGLVFESILTTEARNIGLYLRDWGLITSNYHNGPLGLLICFGIPGFVAALALLASHLISYFKLLPSWKDHPMDNIYKWILACLTARIIMFFTIYGDIQVSFPVFFIFAGLLQALIRAKNEESLP